MAFIVLEGLDGSGKSTQVNLLKRYLEQNSIKYKYIHFPRTSNKIFGELIAKFLRGDLGEVDKVNPYLVSLMYAADRFDAANEMRESLREGTLLLIDRYVVSNIAFQCAKTEKIEEKIKLRNWIMEMEYKKFDIPEPNLYLFLDVPFEFTKNNLENERNGDDRLYLQGKRDIHEESLDFQSKVRDEYISESERLEYMKIIRCYDSNELIMDPKKISEKVINILKEEKLI